MWTMLWLAHKHQHFIFSIGTGHLLSLNAEGNEKWDAEGVEQVKGIPRPSWQGSAINVIFSYSQQQK